MANQDTQWNDVLREKGILAPREKEVTEDQIVDMLDSAAQKQMKSAGKTYDDKTLDELNELSGDEDEKIIMEYRRKRIQEIKERMMKSKFGDVREISAENYVDEVNKAGQDVWVALLLYENSIPLCKILQEYWTRLAPKFPTVKFLKSVAKLCIPNFPEKNLPALFVYYENDLKQQLVGPAAFSHSDSTFLSQDEVEWKLHEIGVLKSDLPPEKFKSKRPTITGINSILLQNKKPNEDSDDEDW